MYGNGKANEVYTIAELSLQKCKDEIFDFDTYKFEVHSVAIE